MSRFFKLHGWNPSGKSSYITLLFYIIQYITRAIQDHFTGEGVSWFLSFRLIYLKYVHVLQMFLLLSSLLYKNNAICLSFTFWWIFCLIPSKMILISKLVSTQKETGVSCSDRKFGSLEDGAWKVRGTYKFSHNHWQFSMLLFTNLVSKHWFASCHGLELCCSVQDRSD